MSSYGNLPYGAGFGGGVASVSGAAAFAPQPNIDTNPDPTKNEVH